MNKDSNFEKAKVILTKLSKNDKKSKYLYNKYLIHLRRSAYRGNSAAQLDLALHYDDIGFWGIKNPYYSPKKKLYWMTKAAKLNEPTACNNLAAMFESGEGGCKIDLNKSMQLYKKAGDLGLKYAYNNYKLLIKQISH